jgi:hypothetical protein
MPLYLYSNPDKPEEIVEIVQSVNDKHEFIKDGVKWNREFTSPFASIDTKIDPFNKRDVLSKTANKKGSLGSIIDFNKELSEKREKRTGVDPVKEKYYENYKRKRGGKHEHPDVIKRKTRDKLKKFGFQLD